MWVKHILKVEFPTLNKKYNKQHYFSTETYTFNITAIVACSIFVLTCLATKTSTNTRLTAYIRLFKLRFSLLFQYVNFAEFFVIDNSRWAPDAKLTETPNTQTALPRRLLRDLYSTVSFSTTFENAFQKTW